jgi:two-component system sensor histidine kinase HydH
LQEPGSQPGAESATSRERRSIAEIVELAGGLAHELRNPLSTMMINLKLLAEELRDSRAEPEEMRRRALLKVETVRRESERLQSLFEDFLQLAAPFGLQRARADLRAVVDHLVDFLEPLLKNNSVEVEVVHAPAPLLCLIDERLLSQGLLNIALNAQQAMPDGGRLVFETGSEAKWAFIRITDEGPGIAPAVQERIFKPFFSTKAKGTGLGLSITRRIVSENGGELSFTTEQGKGTTFTIRLPLDEA